jgi:hypothetical protein
MGYSNYRSLKVVTKKFGLKTERVNLFDSIVPITPSDWLKTTVEYAYMIPLSNEKVKSERLISPILTEVHRLHQDKLSLFSGEELNVDAENDLNGACDFFFSANPKSYLLEAPIITLAEAKDEDMDCGIAQCSAQMIGAMKYNAQEGEPIDTIWGCATTSGEWKFLKLHDNTLYIDLNSYYVNQLDILLGAFHRIFENL